MSEQEAPPLTTTGDGKETKFDAPSSWMTQQTGSRIMTQTVDIVTKPDIRGYAAAAKMYEEAGQFNNPKGVIEAIGEWIQSSSKCDSGCFGEGQSVAQPPPPTSPQPVSQKN